MVALLVVLTIVGFIALDIVYRRKRCKQHQKMFYNAEVGFTLADGGEEIKKEK